MPIATSSGIGLHHDSYGSGGDLVVLASPFTLHDLAAKRGMFR